VNAVVPQEITQRLSGSSTLETGVSGGSYRAKLPFFKPFAQQRLSGKGSLSECHLLRWEQCGTYRTHTPPVREQADTEVAVAPASAIASGLTFLCHCLTPVD